MSAARTLSLVLMTLPFALHAQEKEQPEQPHIDVTGTAEMKVIPDEIYIAIDLRERGSGNNKRTIEQQEAELKEAIVALGIDAAALSLTDALADYSSKIFSKDDVVTSKAYELKVGDAEMTRKVFVELDRSEIEGARVSGTSHSKYTEFRRQMRIQAIKDAKEKADYMLEAIGERTGPPLEVLDDKAPKVEFMFENHSLPGHSKALNISFSRITISESVFVKFAIAKRSE
jgi:uncharacterized protein